MWQKETNSDDRRFLKDIDAIIEVAENGDLHHARNLAGYFCQKVTAGIAPDIRVTKFVYKLLMKSQPPQRLKRWKRDLKLRKALKREQGNGKPLRPSRDNSHSAAKEVSNFLIAEGHPVGESRVLAINYEEIHPILVLDEILKSGNNPSLPDLEAILPDTTNLYRKLLKLQDGYPSRTRLKLKNYRFHSLSELIDKEIVEDVDRRRSEGISILKASNLVADEYGPEYDWQKIRQTWYRHNKSKKNNESHCDKKRKKTMIPA